VTPSFQHDSPGVIRYWGSHFKSPKQAAYWHGIFTPLLARHWRCCLALERLPQDRGWVRDLESVGVEIACVARPRRQIDFACIREVRSLCARFRADVFHCENIHTSPMLGAWLARVPVRVWHKHSMFVHFEECRPPSIKERLALSTRLTGTLATRVMCVSQSVAEEVTQFGVARRKILVRNNPRPVRVTDNHLDRTAARRALNLNGDDYVVVAIGHTVPVKGWDVLVKSFGAVARTVPNARLLLVGSHTASAERACFAELQRLCTEHKVQDKVVFTGHLRDITPALRAADVFVLPSRSEGNSYSLLEALDEGLPCVATKVGAAPEMIQHGANGFLVNRLDVDGLARALTELGSHPDERADFARRVAIPSFVPTFEEYAEQLRRDYESLLGQSSPETAALARHAT
jgi:glycosyltransferase involved in cell wall biosynthesis